MARELRRGKIKVDGKLLRHEPTFEAFFHLNKAKLFEAHVISFQSLFPKVFSAKGGKVADLQVHILVGCWVLQLGRVIVRESGKREKATKMRLR